MFLKLTKAQGLLSQSANPPFYVCVGMCRHMVFSEAFSLLQCVSSPSSDCPASKAKLIHSHLKNADIAEMAGENEKCHLQLSLCSFVIICIEYFILFLKALNGVELVLNSELCCHFRIHISLTPETDMGVHVINNVSIAGVTVITCRVCQR